MRLPLIEEFVVAMIPFRTNVIGQPRRPLFFIWTPVRILPKRLSIRMMMLLIGVVSCVLGSVVHRARVQRQTVQAIRARGGMVEYDYQYDFRRNRRVSSGKPSRPVWLQRALGDDYFHDVVCVAMERDPTDADLALLENLRHVRFLYLGGGRITDDGLRHLRNLTSVRLLILWGNRISGEGLRHLREMKELRHLDLGNTRLADDQLVGLRNLRALERIDFHNNPQLTGPFLDHVADLPWLTSINVRGCGITDAGLSHLKSAKRVQSLMLDNTRVTDAGLANLRGLPISTVDLSYTKVTDAAMASVREWFPRASVKPAPPSGN